MSTSNEIPNLDLESQSTNRTRARPFSKVDLLAVVVLVFPPVRLFVGTHGTFQAVKDILKNPFSHAARRREEYTMRMSKGVTTSILVFAALFSGVVATFLALSIPDLRDKNGSRISLVVNILWLLSLVFSVGSAFFASKVQVWIETYQTPEHQTTGLHTAETHLMPEAHQTTRSGPTRSRETSPPLPKFLEYWIAFLDYFSALLIVLTLEIMRQSLEIAVFFFFLGLIIYVWNISTIAGPFVLAFVCLFFGFYSLVGSAIRIRQVLEVYHNN